MKSIHSLLLPVLLVACSTPTEKAQVPDDWPAIVAQAEGQSINMMMWKGDPLINRYMENFVVPQLKDRYNIQLKIVAGQGSEIVGTLMPEIEAGKAESEIDLVWINGETFYQLRQIEGLYGPFVDLLPHAAYINWEDPFISTDFQQPIAGYECPWGNVQLALIYDAAKLDSPPQTLDDWARWIKANPGQFTIENGFTGMTLLKSWLIHLAGGKGALHGSFDEAKYAVYSQKLWDYINELKPYFWNQGRSFPATIAQMHQLYANGEITFTISNNDSEVDNKIMQGVFPTTSQAYVPITGTIQNSHYLGITRLSPHKSAAMVACNFLISPEAQWYKMQPSVWGDHTVLAISSLPTEWQVKFAAIPGRNQAPERTDIQPLALMEPAPEYMIRLYEDFRQKVIEK